MKNIYLILVCILMSITVHSQVDAARPDSTYNFKWLGTLNYQGMRAYSENRAPFLFNGKWGYMDLNRTIVIKPEFDEVTDFSKGIARVCKDGKWGVINSNRGELFGFIFDEIKPFNDKIALARKGEKYFYLYQNGEMRKLPSTYEFHSYRFGLARVKDINKNKWGFIDNSGVFVIDTKYDKARDFVYDYALVVKKGKTYKISLKGSKSSTTSAFEDSIVVNNNFTYFIKHADNPFVLINSEGVCTNQYFSEVTPFSSGIARVRLLDSTLIYINACGTEVLRPSGIDDCGSFHSGLAWVKIEGKYGFINTQSQIAVEPVFSYVSDYSNGLAVVGADNRLGIIRIKTSNEKYPDLEISEILLRDKNSNNKVEAEEDFSICIKVQNKGKEDIQNARITLINNPKQARYFSYDTNTIKCGKILSGQTKVINFNGKSNTELVSGDIHLDLLGVCDNEFVASNSDFDFKAIGLNQCKPEISNYWVHTPKHTPIKAGDKVILEVTIFNNGEGLAKDVNLDLNWPEGIVAEKNNVKVALIEPHKSVTKKISFTMPDSLSVNNFSMVSNITDFTKKHNKTTYLAFAANQLNSQVNLSGGNSIYMNQNIRGMSNSSEDEVEELLANISQIIPSDYNKYALVIGNEDYNSNKRRAEYEPNVEYAVRDAEAFYTYAQNYLGVPESNIILLKNATCTQMNFNIKKIAKMSKMNPGKISLYVYYAGHGQIDGDTKESFLIPVDVSITSPKAGVKLEDFYATLSSSYAKRTYVFLDACYSGVGRGVIIKPKATPVKGDMVIMTASSSTQRSMPYKDKRHGLFTYFLLKNIKNSQGQASLFELFQQVKTDVNTNSIWLNNMEQTPELINGLNISNNWENWNL
ncbi:MAG: WG repeat-containing protein [Bacteroidales bacterium]